MPDRRMGPCSRFVGGWVNLLAYTYDQIAPFWQTPREVEWAKAAADGLAEREAEEEVAEPHVPRYVGYVGSDGVTRIEHAKAQYNDAMERHYRMLFGLNEAIAAIVPETPDAMQGAVDGPAEGEPPEPSAGVGPNSPKWLRDLIKATENYVGAPPGSLSSPLESVEHAAAVVDVEAGGVFWYAEDDLAHSAAVESPASVPAAECSAPEFDWVTTAIPVIAGVLAEHKFLPIMGRCECPSLPRVADWQRWSEHVSPIIAIAIQSDLLSTIYEDTTFAINAFSGDRPRPLADFPKHQ